MKSITNVTNVVSPVSVISPVTQTVSAPVTATVEATVPTPVETQPTVQQETKVETKTESTASSPTVANSSTEVKQEAPTAVNVPKGKDLVPGFGVVMSMEIINAPAKFQQQEFQIALEYTQELPDGIRGNQEFLTEIISQGSATNLFDIGSKRWSDLYSNYEVQPDY